MAEEQDQVLGHDFDGIQEYDNRLPNWWLWTLYVTIIFGVFYWFFFHTWSWGPLSYETFLNEQARAAEAQLARMEGQELNDETLLLMASVPDNVGRGREIFTSHCTTCHLDDGSGSVGPNLTDNYWIHDHTPMGIHETVTNGVPDKGMAAWGGQLGPSRVQDVVAFVLSIQGTNVPGKEPEGELVSDAPVGTY